MTATRRAAVAALLTAPGSARTAAPDAPTPVSPIGVPLATSHAAHLARRATYAATPEIVADIERMGARAWVDQQLRPASINDAACDAMMARDFPWLAQTSAQIFTATAKQPWRASTLLIRGTTARRIVSKRQLFEVVVDVMTNHVYAVGTNKVQDVVVEFDRTVVRKHALGRYIDFLNAAIKHPTMLKFLDNTVSTKTSPNENLGRELLELYTVGTGHYTEDDVRQASLLLTGHSYSPRTFKATYTPANHYVGPLQVMGFQSANATATGGPAVLTAFLTYLAKHPATARKLCHRLAVRFLSDTPSEALLNDLVRTYQANNTKIAPVVRRLLLHPQFRQSVGEKWRTPAELMVAMVAAGAPTYRPAAPHTNSFYVSKILFDALESAGNNPRTWPAVNGYPDVAAYWLTTSTLQQGWQFADVVAQRSDPEWRPQAWATRLGVVAGQDVWAVAGSITAKLTGYTWPVSATAAIAAMLATGGSGPAPEAPYALSAEEISANLPGAVRLIFCSPYFQLR